ncbi:MAG: hypothetical protein IJ686_06005 [Bacteroidales bacterium]|nr:hypothetical protein [Bacteroidales bacterium]
MKRIITLAAAVLGLCLQAFAAKPEAPVLALGANGALTIANRQAGTSYKYSVSNAGVPSQPETEFPEEGLSLKATGTYNICVAAVNRKGRPVSSVNACLRTYCVAGSIASFTLPAQSSDAERFAPFTISNSGAVDLKIGRGPLGKYWKFEKNLAGGDVQNRIEIGLETLYASNVSFYIKERTGDGIKGKKVYVYFDGKAKGKTAEGIEVPAPVSMAVAGKYTLIWQLGAKGLPGKRVHFRMANCSEAAAWAVLEQGFENF